MRKIHPHKRAISALRSREATRYFADIGPSGLVEIVPEVVKYPSRRELRQQGLAWWIKGAGQK